MNRTRHRFYVVTLVALLSATVLLQADTRVALVLTEPTSVNDSLLALAEAKASALPGVAIVERREIDQVLREQKLSLAGFVNADNAIQAGKLLRADVLAIVEMNAQTTNALGLIVFEARSGARLWDAALPKGIEPAANALVTGLQQALVKIDRKSKTRRVVGVLTTRNADMPRSMDRFCDAVGELFERSLTQNPGVLVLERRRLDQLNRERELASTDSTNPLLASITLVQIDVSRGKDGAGLEAVATLTDKAGRSLDRVNVAIPCQNASELANALAARVGRVLGSNKGTASPDPELQRQEALRFLREARARVSHEEAGAAWRAAEAAHALAPEDAEIEALLMHCLLWEGTKRFGDGSQPHVMEALEFGLRSISFREGRLRQALNEGDAMRMNEEEMRAAAATYSMVAYAEQAYKHCRLSTDAQVREKFGQFCAQFLALDWERFDGWARVATEKPNLFPMFTHVIEGWQGLSVRYLSPKPDEFVARLDRYLRRWLEAANAHPPTVDHANRVSQLFERMSWALDPQMLFPVVNVFTNDMIRPEHLEKLKPTALALAASPSVVIRREGLKFRESVNRWTGKGKGGDGRGSEFVQRSKAIAAVTDLNERLRQYTRLFDAMLQEKFIYSPAVEKASELMRKQLLRNDELVAQFEKIGAAASDDQFAFSTIGFDRHYLKEMLQKNNELIASHQKSASNLPWSDPVPLLDLAGLPQFEALGPMVVSEDRVHAFGVKYTHAGEASNMGAGGQIRIQLLCVPLNGDPVQPKGALELAATGYPPEIPVKLVQVEGNTVYAMLQPGRDGESTGIYEFPPDGGTPVRVDLAFDLPERDVQCFAVVGRTLYLAVPGYVFACDRDSGKVNVLASSRRSDKRSDLDGGVVFRTRFMIPDAKRGRIVLVVERNQRTCEFWMLAVSTGRMTHLFTPDGVFQPEAMSRSGEDLAVFASCFLDAFHLDTGKLERLAQDNWCGGMIADRFPLGRMMEREWMEGAHLIHRGYLWSAGAFGRVPFANPKAERFPPLSPIEPMTRLRLDPNQTGCLVPVGNGDKLVFGSASGVWLLPLRAQD